MSTHTRTPVSIVLSSTRGPDNHITIGDVDVTNYVSDVTIKAGDGPTVATLTLAVDITTYDDATPTWRLPPGCPPSILLDALADHLDATHPDAFAALATLSRHL